MDEALCTKFLLAHLLHDVEVQCLDVKLQRDLSCKLHLMFYVSFGSHKVLITLIVK